MAEVCRPVEFQVFTVVVLDKMPYSLWKVKQLLAVQE
jgi:hypothetical protein